MSFASRLLLSGAGLQNAIRIRAECAGGDLVRSARSAAARRPSLTTHSTAVRGRPTKCTTRTVHDEWSSNIPRAASSTRGTRLQEDAARAVEWKRCDSHRLQNTVGPEHLIKAGTRFYFTSSS